MATIQAQHLKPGYMVDLQQDKYADPNGDELQYESEYAVVSELETDETTTYVWFEDGSQVGFPPEHKLVFAGKVSNYEE